MVFACTPEIPDGFLIESRGCMVILGKAIRQNWQMSDECKLSVVRQLQAIIEGDRPQRWKLRAARLVFLMSQQNGAVPIRGQT